MRIIFCSLALMCVLPACGESTDPSTPGGALHQFRDRLLAHDFEGVYPLLSKKSRSVLEEAHMLLTEQREAVNTVYPPEHRFGARGAYPAGVLASQSPASLLAALLKEKGLKLEASDGLKYGLTERGSPTVLDTSATVATQSGETIHMNFEDGQWRLTIWEASLEQALERIVANQATLRENIQSIKRSGAQPKK